jgi:predicted enzyme related to lactoylglutathione lyase
MEVAMKAAYRSVMILLLALLLTATASTASSSESHSAESTSKSSALLWRSVLIVDDIETATAFYRNVFDLNQAYPKSVIADARIAALLELAPGTSVELVVLISDDISVGNLGLMRILGNEAPAGHGPSILFYKTDRLDMTLEQARTAGAEIVSLPPASPEGPRMFMFRDPWGHRVAVTQRSELTIRYDPEDTSQWIDRP